MSKESIHWDIPVYLKVYLTKDRFVLKADYPEAGIWIYYRGYIAAFTALMKTFIAALTAFCAEASVINWIVKRSVSTTFFSLFISVSNTSSVICL